MTKAEELDWIYRLRSNIYVYMPKEWLIPMNNALGAAIKALEQQPCEDAVSRKAVVEYIKNSDAELGHDSENELVVEDILTMPSVKPVACIATVKFSKEDIHELVNEKMKDIVVERKKGKWANIHDREEWYGDQYRCSLFEDVDDDDFCSRAERRTDE